MVLSHYVLHQVPQYDSNFIASICSRVGKRVAIECITIAFEHKINHKIIYVYVYVNVCYSTHWRHGSSIQGGSEKNTPPPCVLLQADAVLPEISWSIRLFKQDARNSLLLLKVFIFVQFDVFTIK